MSSKKLKTLIIDDEAPARSLVEAYIQKYTDIEIVGEAANGFEALKMIKEKNPDLLFLDIKMPKITGIELLELLDPQPQTIFTTAFDEYAIKAFEMNALDYILKPYTEERFDAAVQKALKNPGMEPIKKDSLNSFNNISGVKISRVVVRNGSDIEIIPLDKILYLEAQDDYVKIYSTKGTFLKQNTLKNYEATFPDNNFIKTHRSYIINLNEMEKIEPYTKDTHVAKMRNGDSVPVSRTGYKLLKEKLNI